MTKPQKFKCAWCGAMLHKTKDGKRLRQHKDATTTCVGSGQPADSHERLRAAAAANLGANRK